MTEVVTWRGMAEEGEKTMEGLKKEHEQK